MTTRTGHNPIPSLAVWLSINAVQYERLLLYLFLDIVSVWKGGWATLRNMHAHCHNKYNEVRQIHNSSHPPICEFSIDGCFLSPFFAKKNRIVRLSEGFPHWSRDTAMCCHPLDNTHSLPSVPPSLPRALLEVTSLTWHITSMWWYWAGMGLRKGCQDLCMGMQDTMNQLKARVSR